jgi:hypothetical protein
MQSKLWKPDISKIEFDLQSRDEIPKLLIGLQHIHSNRKIREKVFVILEKIIPTDTSRHKGRPGMDLWKKSVKSTRRIFPIFSFTIPDVIVTDFPNISLVG